MSNSAVVASVLLGSMMIAVVISLIWLVLNIIATWRIFTKAGEPGWKCLIPFYSQYTLFKLTWSTTIFWIWLVLTFAAAIMLNMESIAWLSSICNIAVGIIGIAGLYKLSTAFGRGIGFALGLVFLNPIFMLILGFGSDRYQGLQ